MPIKTALGGDRLGSGNKMDVEMKTYERSTHNLSYVWRSTASFGTLIPFMSELMLPGDTFDIDLDVDVKTMPTVGPLFGSAKIQCDVFQIPIRHYNAALFQNRLRAGMQISDIKIPLVQMEAKALTQTQIVDNQQMNPSAIFKYLGISGLGKNDVSVTPAGRYVSRRFNAIPWLGYWDIYKCYYANKQENIGAVLHTEVTALAQTITVFQGKENSTATAVNLIKGGSTNSANQIRVSPNNSITVQSTNPMPQPNQIVLLFSREAPMLVSDYFTSVQWTSTTLAGSNARNMRGGYIIGWDYATNTLPVDKAPSVTLFPLGDIDLMRDDIQVNTAWTSTFVVDRNTTRQPYKWALQTIIDGDQIGIQTSKMYSQEGLGLKTYQSDMFQNWLSETWAGQGPGSISQNTAVDTSSGDFTMDQLLLAKKMYNLLVRVAISDGTYRAWIESTYTHKGLTAFESPRYEGGLIKDLYFQEVISNAAAITDGSTQPLGTLGGRGVMGDRHKGGKIIVRCDEPGYTIGIFSCTPRVDYSQGNKWDMNLRTIDDFHKPEMDGIGFQALITDQMAFWETSNLSSSTNMPQFTRAGYQTAWLNYQTNVNRTYGNFADPLNQMFMTFNRRYELSSTFTIKDLTTYIDPVKFNYLFAQTSRDSQNLWVQIGVDIKARRKMSANQIPNL